MAKIVDGQIVSDDTPITTAQIDQLLQSIYDDIKAENAEWRRAMLIEIIGGKKD